MSHYVYADVYTRHVYRYAYMYISLDGCVCRYIHTWMYRCTYTCIRCVGTSGLKGQISTIQDTYPSVCAPLFPAYCGETILFHTFM